MTDEFSTGNGATRPWTSYPDDGRRQLTEFITTARWFGGKGREPEVTDVRRLAVLSDDGPRVVVDLVEVGYADGNPAERDLYQLPLSLYADPEHRLDHAFVGWWEDPEVGWVHAYDAVHDRDAMAVFLRAFAFPPDGPLAFRTLPGVRLDATAPSTPLSAEQSNSSVMFGDEALLKLFRRVTPGVNPDIEIHDVLTRAGSDNVAALLGWLECWTAVRRAQSASSTTRADPAGDAAAVPAHRQRRLGAGADQRAQPVRRGRPVRRRGGGRLRRGGANGSARPWGGSMHCWPSTSPRLSGRAPTTRDLAEEMAGRLDGGARRRTGAGGARARPARPLRGRRHHRVRHRPAGPRRPPPRPDPAHREGLEDRRLRGRAGQAARRAGAARLALARRRRDAAFVRLRPAGDRDDRRDHR